MTPVPKARKKTNDIGWTWKLAREWNKYKSPSRPSTSEIKVYERHIKKLPAGSNILILGSTPEIRDLGVKHQLTVSLCDWSKKIARALGLLMKNKDAKEIFYEQDWRIMDLGRQFDMIIGDCALTVVPYQNVESMLKNIAKHLTIHGTSVQRIWVRHTDNPPSLKRLNELFMNKPKGVHWYTWILFPVLLHYYNVQTESLSGEEMYKKLSEDYKKGKLPLKLVQLFSLVKNHKTPNNVLQKEHLEKVIRRYLRITKIEYGEGLFVRNTPIYVLNKKK